ncbi:MAG: RNA polymerase sigma factor [Gammaproteobacteria bacterium]
MSQESGIPALAQAPDAGSLNAQYSGWVAAIAAGDESALGAFYDATLSRVYGLALRITQSAEAAEEVLNDVYMQVWREAGRYKAARGRVMTWLLTICRSRALDYLRKRNVLTSTLKPKVIDKQTQARGDEPLDLIPSSQVDQGDPQDLLDAVEQHTTVRIALDRLAPLQRQLIALAFYKDMSHQEIAAYTGLALGTVKSHIRRGIVLLRETLRNQTPEEQ